jgi:integrase/recombinase XerD
MAVERKRKKGSWGYRFSRAGKCYKNYGFQTRGEAKEAEIQFQASLKDNPPLPPTALINVISDYLVDSANRGRSEWRVEGLRLCLKKHVLPYFGDARLITDIEFEDVDKLVIKLKKSGLKPKSIWHVVANLRSTLNFAISQKLLRENPINRFSSRKLKETVGSTRSVKAPMDMAQVDKAAESIKNPVDRAWFDVARFTGMRKDECNRLQWNDINFEQAMIHYPGTKTEESDQWLPLAPVALRTLEELRKQSDPDKCPWVFPGRSYQTKGKKVYSRSYMFERIKKLTGIHLKPKDLRDYFATQVSSLVSDPTVVMKLLRHTNMKTTTGYLRTVDNRMRNALQNLGASAGGELGGKKPPQNASNDIQAQLAKLTNMLRIKGFYDNVENSSTWPRAALSSPFIPLAVPTLTCTITAWGRPVTKK